MTRESAIAAVVVSSIRQAFVRARGPLGASGPLIEEVSGQNIAAPWFHPAKREATNPCVLLISETTSLYVSSIRMTPLVSEDRGRTSV